MADQRVFIPVRGSDTAIRKMPITEGYIYFAHDTGVIYMDKGGERYTFAGGGGAGGSSFVWAEAEEDETLFKVDEESSVDPYYYMKIEALEDSSRYPADGLMIINSDGRFFRVLSSDANEGIINLQLIAVSGGGSGGGGSGSGGVTLTIAPDTTTFSTGYTYVYGKTQYITVTGTSKVEADSFVTLEFEVTDLQHGTDPVTYTRESPNGIPYNFNTSILPESNNLNIKVTVSSINSGMKKKDLPSIEFVVKVVSMSVNKTSSGDFIPITTSTSNALTITVVPKGEGLKAQLHASVNGNELDNMPKIEGTAWGKDTTIAIPNQPHGVWPVSFWLTSETANGSIIESDTITYQAAWAEDDNDAPIIWLGEVPDTVIMYESAVIPFMIYDPRAQRTSSISTVNFYQNGGILDYTMDVSYRGTGWYEWDVSNLYTEGDNNFSISLTSGSNQTSAIINFYVTMEGARDLGLEDEGALMMNFTSVGRSNNESSYRRAIWTDTKNNSVIFNNFNWYNNGWKNDNDGVGSYLSIANGASVEIPLGRNLVFNGTNPAAYTIEVRFRVRNIQAYSTLVSIDPHYFAAASDEIPTSNFVMDPNDNTKKLSVSMKDIQDGLYNPAVDKDGNWLMDEANSPKIVKTSEEDGVIFKYMDNNNGLCIGTQEAYFKTPSGTMNVRYKEDEIINLSLVVANQLGFLYLDGVLSGAINLSTAGAITIQDTSIRINSTTCDFDLYKLRIYTNGLTMPQIIHNYISDIHSPTLYDQNQLTRDGEATALSYMKIQKYNEQIKATGNYENMTMPYATIEIIDSKNNLKTPDGGMMAGAQIDYTPFYKGNNRYCKITFVNPVLDAAWEAGDISDDYYIHHCPSFVAIGVEINVQGTSSQGYPRRNFKTKMKSAVKQQDYDKIKHDDWGWYYTNGPQKGESFKKWYMDNDTYSVNKFTWKIDYMESSGSYNTGFANLASTIYNKHPLDDYHISGLSTNGLRTSVYGFPVLTFHKHATSADDAKIGTDFEDEIYEYIGRYNLNLDKSANEAYGFELENEHPYVSGKTIADVSECWELTDNQGTWTSFSLPKLPEGETDYFNIRQEDDSTKLEVVNHFEARYHPEADYIELAAAYKYYDDADTDTNLGNVNVQNSPADMNRYLREKFANLNVLATWLNSTDRNQVKAIPDVLPTPVTYNVTVEKEFSDTIKAAENRTLVQDYVTYVMDSNELIQATYTHDTKEYRLEKFRNEFKDHLDEEYCAVYFLLTELCICYDSRGKNMMLASFGPQKAGGDYIWYPIFYDIDTQLGLNNIGATLWDYDVDATLEGSFSTPHSVLWDNFYDAFKDIIIAKYRSLRTASKLTYDTVNGSYACDPTVFNSYAMRGIRPIIAIGLDEYVKYISPTITGYIDRSGNIKKDANYYYAINGDRKLSRELLLRNRFNYIDSWWSAGDHAAIKARDGFSFRLNGNKASDTYLDSASLSSAPEGYTLATYPVQYFDAIPQLTVTPFLNEYIVTYNDLIPNGAAVKYQGTPVQTTVSESVVYGYKTVPNNQEQIVMIPATDYISSLGDLSTKYLSQCTMGGGKRLVDLTLGSDIPGYFNNLLAAGGQFSFNDALYTLDGKLNPDRKTLLKKVILSNVTELADALELTGSEKLVEFRALNTQIPNVIFAEGAPLDTIHLPKSVQKISLVENRNLTRILTSKPQAAWYEGNEVKFADAETLKGLYIENVTDYVDGVTDLTNSNNLSSVNYINIKGGALEYDSYTLLNNLIQIKEKVGGEGIRLQINLSDVHWSPYTVIDDDEYLPDVYNYYYLTDHNTFKPYIGNSDAQYSTFNADQWNIDFINERIFTKDNSAPEDTIKNLDLINLLIDDYDNTASGLNHYTNTDSTGYKARAALTGTLYVNNTAETAINELDIGNRFKTAFPNLNIYAAYVNESFTSRFVMRADNGKDTLIDILRFDDSYQGNPSDLTTEIPQKNNWDFIGWAIDPEGRTLVADYVEGVGVVANSNLNSFLFNRANNVTLLTFYAIFRIHKYKMTFYNYDNTLIQIVEVPYSIERGISGPTILPVRTFTGADNEQHPNGDSNLFHTYKFNGWQKTSNGQMVDLADVLPTTDISFIATFVDVSVYQDVLDEKYLSVTYKNDFVDAEGNTVDGYVLQINDTDYNIGGKITLPIVVNGSQGILPVRAFGGATGGQTGYCASHVSHIFWAQESLHPEVVLTSPLIQNIAANACNGWYKLVYFDPLPSITSFSAAAFYQTSLGYTLGGSVIYNMLNATNNVVFARNVFANIGGLNYETGAMIAGNSLWPVEICIPGKNLNGGNPAFNGNNVFVNSVSYTVQIGKEGDPAVWTTNDFDGTNKTIFSSQCTNLTIYTDQAHYDTMYNLANNQTYFGSIQAGNINVTILE